jgi:hypothetical protein
MNVEGEVPVAKPDRDEISRLDVQVIEPDP